MASTLISPETNLLLHRREVLRAHFVADVAAGTARPFVLPFDLLGTVLLPIIYLCIPHTRRPWLYRLRFAVVGLMVWLNYNMMMTASSTNFAAAYMVGLLGVWGTLWGTTMLVWMRPQFDAERVGRRLTGLAERQDLAAGRHGHLNGLVQVDVHGDVYGDVNRGVIRRYTIGTVKENGGIHGNPKPGGCNSAAPDQTVAAALSAGYTYYWQSYPSDSPLSTRLGWAFDYATSIRGPGWSTTSISSIPSFRRPSKPLSDSPVDLSSIPLRTLTGFSRYTTSLSFLAHRLRQMALAYIVFDFLSFAMQNDPYFILGPEHAAAHPLPPYLSSLHPLVLPIFRSSLVVTAIIASAHLAMGIAQLLHFCVSHSHPALIRLVGARSDIWQYPDVCGGFASNVLDYGLAGFWGGWWHQNFRACFVAPANWLAQHGYLPRDRRHPVRRFAGAAIAFVLSGALHAGGSFTSLSMGEARWWNPPVFFLLNLVGVSVQAAWDRVVPKEVRGGFPLWVRRAANLLFVWAWLHATQWLFIDDLCRDGLWLYEPVPFSVVRALGYGGPGDPAWRWDRYVLPRLWTGGRWWERGLAI